MDVGLSISGIVVIIVMILLTCLLWKVTKLLLIPIQILLFLVLMFIAYKLLFSPENMDKISNQVTNEKIQGLVNKASDSAARFVKKTAEQAVGMQKSADNDQSAAAQAGKDVSDAAKTGENTEKSAESVKEAAPAAREKTEQAVQEKVNPEKS